MAAPFSSEQEQRTTQFTTTTHHEHDRITPGQGQERPRLPVDSGRLTTKTTYTGTYTTLDHDRTRTWSSPASPTISSTSGTNGTVKTPTSPRPLPIPPSCPTATMENPHTPLPSSKGAPAPFPTSPQTVASARNGHEDPINVNPHVNANAPSMGIYGYGSETGIGRSAATRYPAASGAGADRARSVSASSSSAHGHGQGHAKTNAGVNSSGKNGGVGTGTASIPLSMPTSILPSSTAPSSMPRTPSSTQNPSLQVRQVNISTTSTSSTSTTSSVNNIISNNPKRRPSLASPLPPTPLVPSSTPKRYAPPPPLGLEAASPSSAGLTSPGAAPSSSSPRVVHGRHISNSLTSPSHAGPGGTPPPPYSASNNSPNHSTPPHHTHNHSIHTQYPSIARPSTAPSSHGHAHIRPESPSTSAMMKRLLSKPAPVGTVATSGSESEGFSGMAGVGSGVGIGGGMGYTRRKKEAFPSSRSGARGGNGKGGAGHGALDLDIDFNMNLDVLDQRIATLGEWVPKAYPSTPNGAVRVGTGMNTYSDSNSTSNVNLRMTPGSSPGHGYEHLYRIGNGSGSGSASGHGHASASASSSPAQSSVWTEAKEREREKEKRKPNVLRRKGSMTATSSSSALPSSTFFLSPNLDSSTPALPPQPIFSPLTLSPLPPQSQSQNAYSSSSYQNTSVHTRIPTSPSYPSPSQFSPAYPSSQYPYASPQSSSFQSSSQFQNLAPYPNTSGPNDITTKNGYHDTHTATGPEVDSSDTHGFSKPVSNHSHSSHHHHHHDPQETEKMEMGGERRGRGQHHHEFQRQHGGQQGQAERTYHHQQGQQNPPPQYQYQPSDGSYHPNSNSNSTPPTTSTNTNNGTNYSNVKPSSKGKSSSTMHRSASASAVLSSSSSSSSRRTQPSNQDEAFKAYQAEYQMEYMRFQLEQEEIMRRAGAVGAASGSGSHSQRGVVPGAAHLPSSPTSATGNTLRPPAISYTRGSSSNPVSRSASRSPSAFGSDGNSSSRASSPSFSLARSVSLSGSANRARSQSGDGPSRSGNRRERRRSGSPVVSTLKPPSSNSTASPLPSPRNPSKRVPVPTSPTRSNASAPRSPLFFGMRGGARGDGGKVHGKEAGKETGRGRRTSTTPAASLIEAYKKQERERDDLARMARGEDVGLKEESVGEAFAKDEEGVGMEERWRYQTHVGEIAVDTDTRMFASRAEQEHEQREEEGRLTKETVKNSTQSAALRTTTTSTSVGPGPSRRHSFSLSSHSGPSLSATRVNTEMAATATITTTLPITTTTTTTAAPAAVSIRRNLTVDGATLAQRKSGYSFASGLTTDSGLDLDVGRRIGDLAEAGSIGGRGFDAIERTFNGNHLTTASSSTATSKSASVLGLVGSIKTRSVSTPASTSDESRPISADVAPYYTIFGSSSGRVVAVGSREDAWAAYGQAVAAVGVGAEKGKEKEKEKVSLGRTLSKKVSGRWKKPAGGGNGVFEHGRASMQHDGHKRKTEPKIMNRRSLRLSIDKIADDDHSGGGGVTAFNGGNEVDTPVQSSLITAKGVKEASPASGGGGRFWRLMKRISIGGGLREKFHETSTECLPPVPPLPPSSRILHGSRSIDSSLKNARGMAGDVAKSSSASSSPGLPSRPSVSSSMAKPLPLAPSSVAASAAPRPSTTTRSSSPVSSSDVASSKFFNRTHSTHSSTSSLGDAPPPLPMLQQHIIPPSELRRVHSPDDDRQQQHPDPASKQLWNISIPAPDPTALEDWMIVRSPSVELSSLPLPPRRFMAQAPTSMTAAVNAVVTSSPSPASVKSVAPAGASNVGLGAAPFGEDEDEVMDRSESPTIPSFSTSGAVNAFPSRRESASLSHRSRSSPAVSPTGGMSPSSVSPPITLSPPPPPRPSRSAQRPILGSSPSHSAISPSLSSSLPTTTNNKPYSNEPPTQYLAGRKSESHVTNSNTNVNGNVNRNSPNPNAHHRRSSGGMSTVTIKAFSSQRRSSSIGVGGSNGPSSPVGGIFGKSSKDKEKSKNRDEVKDGKDQEKKFALTEKEKAEKWADLLERSERAGGTLRVDLGVGV